MTRTSSAEPYAEVNERDLFTEVFLFLRPVPASRPRVTRWGTYYSKTYKDWMAAADAALPEATVTYSLPVHVRLTIVCHRPKSTKLLTPRGDIDNYEKAIYDALTKKNYWTDDTLIQSHRVLKRYAEAGEHPHYEIEIRDYHR